jgi:hypothetical protein
VGFTGESLGNVPAHRVDGIVSLALRFEISGESRPLRELEDLAAYFIGELPHDEFRIMTRWAHATRQYGMTGPLS